MTTPDFGSDVSTFPGLDPMFSVQSGPRVLGEALARVYSTPKGSDRWHPEYGRDLRRFLNEAMDTQTLALVQAEAEEGAELDERVAKATATAAFSAPTGVLSLQVQVETSDGPFFFVFSLTEETATLLLAR